MITRPRQTRRQGTRGAAIVELALVVPFLVLVAFGVAEMGLAWVSGSRLESAVSTAARTGSSSGSTADADLNILLSLRASLPDDLLANATRVVVYSSNAAGDIAPACLTNAPGTGVGDGSASSGANRCNVYSGDMLRSVTATPPGNNLGAADDHWRGTNRRDRLAGPPDYIGVLVETRHNDVTGTFWDDFALTRSSVYRIAPDVSG